ncbi:endonuclease/exonuclease/phosphatase family protein [Halovenus halobia]|uniref:endonuclease/exonuclease/phosphatase family protein n=1 Tax=Halovenus halobia TaxID=3396622 RepID=UPI003F552354
MTYNVRHAILDDGTHSWPNRRDGVIERVRAADSDILGVQECTGEQQVELATGLPEYEWLASPTNPARVSTCPSVFGHRGKCSTPRRPGSLNPAIPELWAGTRSTPVS